MTLTQPQNDIALPDDVAKAIENAKNATTMLEAEKVRLNGLIQSLEYTITQSNLQINTNNEQIAAQESMLTDLQNQCADKALVLEFTQKSLVDAKEALDVATQAKTALESDLKARTEVLDTKEVQLASLEKDLANRNVELTSKEDDLKAKLEKVDQIRATL